MHRVVGRDPGLVERPAPESQVSENHVALGALQSVADTPMPSPRKLSMNEPRTSPMIMDFVVVAGGSTSSSCCAAASAASVVVLVMNGLLSLRVHGAYWPRNHPARTVSRRTRR